MAKKNKKKNPNKSWRKLENETWLNYFDRILTYNRLQVMIGFLGLILASLSYYYTFIHVDEREVIKESIEKNISIIESKLDRNFLMSKNDTTEHNALITEFQNDILDYISLWKSVSSSNLSENYADMPLKELLYLLQNEFERRLELGNSAKKMFYDINSIRSYEYLTDTLSCTKLSKEKQKLILGLVTKQNTLDSISTIKIKNYFEQIVKDYQRNLNYRKDLKKCISEMKDMTHNLNWYYFHNAIMDFVVESNNLFEISRRKYQNIPPYKFFEETYTKLYPNDTTKKEIVKKQLIQVLNNLDFD